MLSKYCFDIKKNQKAFLTTFFVYGSLDLNKIFNITFVYMKAFTVSYDQLLYLLLREICRLLYCTKHVVLT